MWLVRCDYYSERRICLFCTLVLDTWVVKGSFGCSVDAMMIDIFFSPVAM